MELAHGVVPSVHSFSSPRQTRCNQRCAMTTATPTLNFNDFFKSVPHATAPGAQSAPRCERTTRTARAAPSARSPAHSSALEQLPSLVYENILRHLVHDGARDTIMLLALASPVLYVPAVSTLMEWALSPVHLIPLAGGAPDTERCKYLAHVRDVDMPPSWPSLVGHVGIVCHREPAFVRSLYSGAYYNENEPPWWTGEAVSFQRDDIDLGGTKPWYLITRVDVREPYGRVFVDPRDLIRIPTDTVRRVEFKERPIARLPPGTTHFTMVDHDESNRKVLPHLAKSFPSTLQSLTIFGNLDPIVGMFLGMFLPANLRILDLAEVTPEGPAIEALTPYMYCAPHLHTLVCPLFAPTAASALIRVFGTALRELDISAAHLSLDDLTNLVQKMPPRLAWLRADSVVVPAGAWPRVLQHLPATLVDLSLASSKIDDADVAALAQAIPPALMSLNLSNNRIGPAGVVHLAPALPAALYDLSLSINPLGEAGLVALLEHCPPRLVRLSLVNGGFNGTTFLQLVNKLPPSIQVVQLGGSAWVSGAERDVLLNSKAGVRFIC
ncbi:hypothetical protein AMAG_15236 [Allomyces macrogynus ATCC 38327]|uniref:F-box domain-containing protein n=1 Tax=Allomyces macrogynus (strain ATCC 38327) TaxID=578462 RepID=A0A0L0T8X1_ALLM3|nr:hypothetical protein AMAG_15236 [Allomyces macrogynus ATCC 38327]|eukprot:KNE70974.1 hypothetical protein AMAG_15236 [Allomyces macrogynus ATCC 38327]